MHGLLFVFCALFNACFKNENVSETRRNADTKFVEGRDRPWKTDCIPVVIQV